MSLAISSQTLYFCFYAKKNHRIFKASKKGENLIENIPNEKIIRYFYKLVRFPEDLKRAADFQVSMIFIFSQSLKILIKMYKTSQNVFEREHLKVLNLIKKNLQKQKKKYQ